MPAKCHEQHTDPSDGPDTRKDRLGLRIGAVECLMGDSKWVKNVGRWDTSWQGRSPSPSEGPAVVGLHLRPKPHE